MFRLIPNPTFVVAVPLTVPGSERLLVNFTFRHKSKAALKDWVARVNGSTSVSVLAEVVADWSGVEDGEGKPVPFSSEALATMVDNYPTAGREIFDAYFAELTESRTKN